jgi:plasmid stabilization system protein ParE
MALPDRPGQLPGNLSRQAVDDLIRILRRSAREFGVAVFHRSRARLLMQIEAIQDGTAIGHRRPDVPARRPTRFLNEDPWVICFNPDTRQVYRILHGARDFPALFGGSNAGTGTRDDDTA